MIRVGLLLAAGASRRFGAEDKLLATLNDRPLITYAAQAMRGAGLDRLIAVVANPALKPYLDDFEIVEIESPEQSVSIRAGVVAAGDFDRLLIALADMPGITCTLLKRLLEAAADSRPSASYGIGPPMPPACFPAAWLSRLSGLSGDRGAGALIRDLPPDSLIYAPELLQDIDTVEQLSTTQRCWRDTKHPL